MLTQKNYMKLEFPARSVNEGFARAAVAAFAAQLDPTLAEIGDIKTAVSEAVTNAVVHAYPDKLGAVKVSRSIKERAQGIRTARTRLEQTLGREPTLSELSAETGLEPEEIAAAETATGPTESLQKENGETGFTLEHTLGDYDQEERMVEYAALREALRQLPERERQVIALRFYHGLTQQRAAGILHISQVQVSRLERRAVERLREWLAT